jgi:hypothetical protein
MNYWIWLILFAALAMAVGPIMMLQPDASQRKRQMLRAKAMAQGLRVSMTPLPQRPTDTEAPDALAAYCYPSPALDAKPWLLMRAAYTHEAHFLGQWYWPGPERASASEQVRLTQLLPQLPNSIRALSRDLRGYSFHWTESEGEDFLPFLQQKLIFLAADKKS